MPSQDADTGARKPVNPIELTNSMIFWGAHTT